MLGEAPPVDANGAEAVTEVTVPPGRFVSAEPSTAGSLPLPSSCTILLAVVPTSTAMVPVVVMVPPVRPVPAVMEVTVPPPPPGRFVSAEPSTAGSLPLAVQLHDLVGRGAHVYSYGARGGYGPAGKTSSGCDGRYRSSAWQVRKCRAITHKGRGRGRAFHVQRSESPSPGSRGTNNAAVNRPTVDIHRVRAL